MQSNKLLYLNLKYTEMTTSEKNIELSQEINELRKQKNAVILAHYYQEPEIQDIADFIGDSLDLSKKAASTDADIIVFAGVHFMAETAKILNPSKKVLLPDMKAGCSLADSCPSNDFEDFIKDNPNYKVVSYINCTAEIKAMSDVICTSSNALKIINSFDKNDKIIFAPDKNLGKFLAKKAKRELKLWDGACTVHQAFSLEKLTLLKAEFPDSKIIAHPESEDQILNEADFIGSTSALLKFVQEDSSSEFIVATEYGIIHQMKLSMPQKTFLACPAIEDNTCACSQCEFMKMNTLEKLYNCLLNESPEITLDEELLERSKKPLNRMMELSV